MHDAERVFLQKNSVLKRCTPEQRTVFFFTGKDC